MKNYLLLFIVIFALQIWTMESTKKAIARFTSIIRTVSKIKSRTVLFNNQKIRVNVRIHRREITKTPVVEELEHESGYGIKIEEMGQISELDPQEYELEQLVIFNSFHAGSKGVTGSRIEQVKIFPSQIETDSEKGIVFDFGNKEPSMDLKKVLRKLEEESKSKSNKWALPFNFTRKDFKIFAPLFNYRFAETWLVNDNKQIFKFTLIFPLFTEGTITGLQKARELVEMLNGKRPEMIDNTDAQKKEIYDEALWMMTEDLITKVSKTEDQSVIDENLEEYKKRLMKIKNIVILEKETQEIDDMEDYIQELTDELNLNENLDDQENENLDDQENENLDKQENENEEENTDEQENNEHLELLEDDGSDIEQEMEIQSENQNDSSSNLDEIYDSLFDDEIEVESLII